MRIPQNRRSVVAGVFVVSVASMWALAAPNPFPSFVVKCSKYTCPGPYVCVYPYTANGVCTQGKNGPGFGQNIGCCCCSEDDASNRWFHGE